MSRPAASLIDITYNLQLIQMIEEETIRLVPSPIHTFTIQYLEKTLPEICELLRYV